MFRQVGNLVIDEKGIARRGVLIRHLVLPGNLAGSADVFGFIAGEVSTDSFVNIMDQYCPAFQAGMFGELARPTTEREHLDARRAAHASGLRRGFAHPAFS
jgi:putative pyruvate formate lyase activating enzyme